MPREFPENIRELPGDKNTDTDPFKCWFEFLQASDETTWSQEVREDFGNVKDTIFEMWWPDHKILFETYLLAVIRELTTEDDLKQHIDEELYDDPDMAVISIFMHSPRHQIIKEFNNWLKTRIPSKRGAPKKIEKPAIKYGFSIDIVDTFMLRKVLKTYIALKAEAQKPESAQRNYYEIEDELKLIDKKKKIRKNIVIPAWKKPYTVTQKQTQTETISRYKRIAEEIMKNVVEGYFPVYSENLEDN